MSLLGTLQKLRTWLVRLLSVVVLTMLLAGSTIQLLDASDHVRRFTRQREFNFLDWTLDALLVKVQQLGLSASDYLQESERQALVRMYFELVSEVMRLETRLEEIYADPSVVNPEIEAVQITAKREAAKAHQSLFQPTIEAVIQEQAAYVLSEMGLDLAGAPFPPVAFHFTRPPVALIVSPRDIIRQDANIPMDPALALEERMALELRVENGLDVSALVVQIGGIGIYPTMVQQSTSLAWVVETVVHEWIHNYLTLRPLGLNYETSPELRVMNETAANLMGKEIGRQVLARYYPDLVPVEAEIDLSSPASPQVPPVFDFRMEMHQTRVTVDEMLSQGRIGEAEAYMEERRQVFWENGYRIRRLNQAYFAFYGAYADEPGGAAGEDPVGAAVRLLWKRIASPVEFLRTMSWMDSYADLQEALGRLNNTP
jgi:hypothetical protein